MAKKVLLMGESWSATTLEVKGFNSFFASKYETGLGWIDRAIERAGYEFVYLPNHEAAENFPYTLEEIKAYDCIILSDIGADTLQIPPATFSRSTILPNRCNLLRDYVLEGGALLMIGGYMTFSGIGGQGKWCHSAVQEVLPVQLLPYDDRMEHCEGVTPETALPDHPIMQGIEGNWPRVLGYNKSSLRQDATLVASICGDPFIAVADYGRGRSGIFSTDCAPHWAPPEFCAWKYYDLLFKNMIDYLIKPSP